MAIRLAPNRDPEWVDLGRGAALLCAPPTTIVTYAARARAAALIVSLKEAGTAVTKAGGQIEGLPDLADEDLGEGLYNALFMVSMAEIAASDWRGINDRDGKPLIFDAGLIASLFQDHETVAHFRSEYFRPIHEVEAEGNV